MKGFYFVILLFPFLTIGQDRTSNQLLEKQMQKYSVEKGIINYTISGDAEGIEIFTFDRFGWRSLKSRTMTFELYGIESTQTQHESSDGELVYRIYHSDSTFEKKIDMKWSSIAGKMNPKQASESVLFSLGGKHSSDSTLLDKTCEVWTFENRSLKEMWIWEGLVLKRVSKLGEKNIITTADNIDLSVSIDESIFDLPIGYQPRK